MVRQHWMVVLIWLAPISVVCAGLYNPTQPKPELAGPKGLEALPFELFRSRLGDAMSIGVTTTVSKARAAALAERDRLKKLPSPTLAEQVWLGITQLKLLETDAGFATLQQAYARNRNDYWVMTALGTAYQRSGQWNEAMRYLEAARDLLPPDWPDRAAAQAAESAQLKLARLRLREQAARPGRRPPEEVDDLFGIHFVDANGKYTAGALPAGEKEKLPANAVAVVQQVLLWLPGDARLYWLLGELYNAAGDIDSAEKIFSECLNARRLDSRTLLQRRQILQAALAARPAPAPASDWKPSGPRWWLVVGIGLPVVLVLAWLQLRQLLRSRTARKK